MTLSHDKKETVRTVDSVISILLQAITLGVQCFGLWYITHHPH